MKKFLNNKGFTMVELIIVIAIIAVLAAVLAPQYLRFVEESRESTDVDTAAKIEAAVNVLVADGTIEVGDSVTWTPASGAIAASGTNDTDVLTAQLNAASGSSQLQVTSSVAKEAAVAGGAAEEIVWNVAEDATTNMITVSTTYDYHAWAD